jgi:hypothetical protein
MPEMHADSGPRPTRKTRGRAQPEPRPSAAVNTEAAAVKEDVASHPLLQTLKDQFGAQLIACTPLDASSVPSPR